MTDTDTIKELKRITKKLAATETRVDDLRSQQKLLIKKAIAEGMKGVDVAKIANVSKSWIWQVKQDYVRKVKNATVPE